jgi:ribosomal protein S18 acetylase RimI-like enzyme
LYNIRIINKDEFLDVYKLMQLSFPPAEFRTYEEELALFSHSDYQVIVIEKNSVIYAFIAEWIFGDVHFIEHFAILPEHRGKGLGTKIIREYLKHIKSAVVIEVEANDTKNAKRRIAFYERLGFIQSNIEYMQPLLRKKSPDVLLRLMHYPADITDDALHEIKQKIFQTVYI